MVENALESDFFEGAEAAVGSFEAGSLAATALASLFNFFGGAIFISRNSFGRAAERAASPAFWELGEIKNRSHRTAAPARVAIRGIFSSPERKYPPSHFLKRTGFER